MKVTKVSKSKLVGLTILILLLSQHAQAKSSSKKSSSKSVKKSTVCIVDRCAVCPDKKTILCQACKPGWYLRTYTSGEKTYNACWSTSKLILALLGSLLLSLLVCGICGVCYTLGKKAFHRIPMHYPEEYPREVPRPSVYVEEPPVVVSQMPMPRRVIRQAPPIYSSPMSTSRAIYRR